MIRAGKDNIVKVMGICPFDGVRAGFVAELLALDPTGTVGVIRTIFDCPLKIFKKNELYFIDEFGTKYNPNLSTHVTKIPKNFILHHKNVSHMGEIEIEV